VDRTLTFTFDELIHLHGEPVSSTIPCNIGIFFQIAHGWGFGIPFAL
jgi:hypothetical protein